MITGFLGAGKTTLVNYVLNEVYPIPNPSPNPNPRGPRQEDLLTLPLPLPLPLPYPHPYPHLSQDHGKKICVIENEFGAINIDTGLVAENMKVPNPNPNPNPP